MPGSPRGEFSARQISLKRQRFRWSNKWYKRRKLGLDYKADPLEGAPQARGIVLEKVGIESKQPNSAIRKCVSPDTLVLLDDLTALPMNSLIDRRENHQQVSFFNRANSSIGVSQIVDAFELSVEEVEQMDAMQIVTKTGRSLTASGDHPIYTERGIVSARDITPGDLLVVLPSSPVVREFDDSFILREEHLRRAVPPSSHADWIIAELKDKGLLPFRYSNPHLPVITKLIGHIFGDGHLALTPAGTGFSGKVMASGQPEDLEDISGDLEHLGFHVSPMYTRASMSLVTSQNGRQHTISGSSNSISCTSIALFTFLSALGAPVGRKATQESVLPNWIGRGPRWVKAHFLASYFGSELEKPRHCDSTFQPPSLEVSKAEGKVQSGMEFIGQIEAMLSEFGVSSSNVRIRPSVIGKDGTRTFKIRLTLSSNIR
ncbi:MAG TPA: hypothetical protein VIW22_04850, partial [Nitrososphaerales archaeon]